MDAENKQEEGKVEEKVEEKVEDKVEEKAEEKVEQKEEDKVSIEENREPQMDNKEIRDLDIKLNEKEKTALYSIVKEAFDTCTSEKEIASYIKKQFDNEFGPSWHCIVGILNT